MNRIEQAIGTFKAKFLAHGVSDAKIEEMGKSANMDFTMWAHFQNVKSLAQMDERLSLPEAMTIYRYLGGSPEAFNNQPAEIKIVLSFWYAHLLKPKEAA